MTGERRVECFRFDVEKSCLEKIVRLSKQLGISKSDVVEKAINYCYFERKSSRTEILIETYIKFLTIKGTVENILLSKSKREFATKVGFSIPVTCHQRLVEMSKCQGESTKKTLAKCVYHLWYSFDENKDEVNYSKGIIKKIKELLNIK